MLVKQKKGLIVVVTAICSHDRQAAPSRGYRQAADSLCRYGVPPILLQGSAQICQVGWGLLPSPGPLL